MPFLTEKSTALIKKLGFGRASPAAGFGCAEAVWAYGPAICRFATAFCSEPSAAAAVIGLLRLPGEILFALPKQQKVKHLIVKA